MNTFIKDKGENYKSKLIEENLTKDNDEEFDEKPREEDWFKPHIDKKVIRELSKTRALPCIISISAYFSLSNIFAFF